MTQYILTKRYHKEITGYIKLCKTNFEKYIKMWEVFRTQYHTKMRYFFPFVIFSLIYGKSNCVQIIWDNNVDFDSVEVEELGRSDQVRMPNWFFIFPGTKWCGAGNIAEDENDFGEFRDTDKCCRNHDLCPDIIEGYQSKHNLTNPSFFTRLNCECDEEFHKCLKSVNSRVSTQIGQIYFTALGTQCYREDYPIVSCKKYSYLPRRKCKEYELDESKDKVYEWFDVPNY
nr:PREDICTED: phospholipase A2A isoform X1 [Tribolium castaneum]|eukprot:XP_015833910.1 PREDICTED: phospholipase A2A isoform X1 [Tribolium castaneum]